jgi:hypothetical protein
VFIEDVTENSKADVGSRVKKLRLKIGQVGRHYGIVLNGRVIINKLL